VLRRGAGVLAGCSIATVVEHNCSILAAWDVNVFKSCFFCHCMMINGNSSGDCLQDLVGLVDKLSIAFIKFSFAPQPFV
jgi:hypothetical protein